MRKYNYDDVVKAFKEKNYKLLSKQEEYINVNTKLKYICPKHKDKGIQEISLSKLLINRGCYYCGRERTENAKRKPLDYEFDKKLAESKGFTYVGTRRADGLIYIDFICNKHKDFGVQSMRKGNMKRDIKGCKYCRGNYPKEYVLQMIKEINPDVELLEPYVNITTRIKCKCKKHGVISTKTPQEILLGRGCYLCGREKLSEYHLYSQEEFSNKLYQSNPNLEVIGKYKGMEFPIKVKCKKCGYEWENNTQSLITNGTSCRKCSYRYKGEEKILKILQKYNINYTTQHKFVNCKDIRPLPFDFYLQDYNLCIEFDGQQHYEPRFGEINFQKTLFHDQIKNEYCKNNNIKLLRIPYWEYDNIETIITDKLIKNDEHKSIS